MRFGIDKIRLCLNNGSIRDINFLPDKINVITGKSGTGKTAILDIFDYCLASSTHSISESVINESVNWYFIRFYINNKHVTIGRKSPVASAVSDKYFLSTRGEIPDFGISNTTENDIKSLFQTELGIENDVLTPFGGKALKGNSKISFRYFLLFCTISQDIITNSSVFFDKQSQDRYREALPRVFDLAMGIDDADNIVARETRAQIEGEIAKLEKRQRINETNVSNSSSELQQLASRAASLGLINENSVKNPQSALEEYVASSELESPLPWQGELDRVSALISDIDRKTRNAKRFEQEYQSYKSSLAETLDSLKPIEILADNEEFLVKSPSFRVILDALKENLKEIKKSNAAQNPVNIQIRSILKEYSNRKSELVVEKKGLPALPEAFSSEKEKWIFIGEIKGQLSAYSGQPKTIFAPLTDEIEHLGAQLNQIKVVDVLERRDLAIRTIEKNAQKLLNLVALGLENYADYEPIFNYKDKKLQLRKPSALSIENVGSSSNHMLLHLVHMLALHQLAIENTSKFVPSFLIIDQPSRPYYGDEAAEEKLLNNSDNSKITSAMQMLNDFVSMVRTQYSEGFQMIVFEHIPPAIWEGMSNFHLVEVFRDGNALIPESANES